MVREATVTGDLNDGAVDVYELPAANGEIVARLDAERLAGDSDLDSVLYVYSPSVGFVTFNDDASTSTDSEVNFNASAGTTNWLVIDATGDRVLLLQESAGMMLQASTFPLTAILDDKWTQHLELTECLWLRALARRAPFSTPQEILDAAFSRNKKPVIESKAET